MMNMWSEDRNERIRSFRISAFIKHQKCKTFFCFCRAHFSYSLNVVIGLIVFPSPSILVKNKVSF